MCDMQILLAIEVSVLSCYEWYTWRFRISSILCYLFHIKYDKDNTE